MDYNNSTIVRVLIVEDEEEMAKIISRIVQDCGFQVLAVVDTAEAAIRRVKENPPDIVLMDIGLKGGESGIEAAHQIRKFSDVEIIYLTVYADEATLQEAKATGPFAYIVKPFGKEEIKILIKAVLYKAGKERELKGIKSTYNLCLNSFGGISFRSDLDLVPTLIEGPVEEFTGYKKETILQSGPKWEEVLHPEEEAELSGEVLQKLKTIPNFMVTKEYRITNKKGEPSWVRKTVRNVCDDFGKPIYIEGVIFDVGKVKELERKLDVVISEYSKFKRMVITREEKMIKLKEEIVKLRKALGRSLPDDE